MVTMTVRVAYGGCTAGNIFVQEIFEMFAFLGGMCCQRSILNPKPSTLQPKHARLGSPVHRSQEFCPAYKTRHVIEK